MIAYRIPILIILLVLLVSFYCTGKSRLYIGKVVITETGESAPMFLIDKRKTAYYHSFLTVKSQGELLDYLRTYCSKGIDASDKDSIRLNFDSIVTSYTIIEGVAFGKPQHFVELHYDKARKVYIRGKRTGSLNAEVRITTINVGKDTTTIANTFHLGDGSE